jgi:hypothetical protein
MCLEIHHSMGCYVRGPFRTTEDHIKLLEKALSEANIHLREVINSQLPVNKLKDYAIQSQDGYCTTKIKLEDNEEVAAELLDDTRSDILL